MRKKKLGVTYSLFSGEELLRGSILSIRKSVDYINVIYQDISWMGTKAEDGVLELLQQLKEEGLIDNYIKFEFETKNKRNSNYYRCKKENIGVKDLKKAGCTHCMLMDVDEYYFEEEFEKAKNYVYTKNITHSCCSIYDYRILPIYRMRDARDYAVPFILKIGLFSYVIAKSNLPCKADVFRTFPFLPWIHKFYYLNNVSMHHMTGIRKDYKLKLASSITNVSEKGKKVVREYEKMHNTMKQMNEDDILKNDYIKVADNFGILKDMEKNWNISEKNKENEM